MALPLPESLPKRSLVVVPTYDEAENVLPLVAEVLDVAPELEVLVVDDNSPDGTGDLPKCCAISGSLGLAQHCCRQSGCDEARP